MLPLTALIFATSLLCPPAAASPWVRDPGHAYVKAGYVRFVAGEYVDPTGRTTATDETLPAYVGNTQHLYAEVGVLPHLQIVANLPFVGSRNSEGDTAFINRALGDADLGLATGTTLGDWPVSLSLSTKVPLYDNADLNQYGSLAERFPAIGDGQVDITALAAVGRPLSVGGQHGWTVLAAGYRHRTEWWLGDSSKPDREILDGIPWHAQLGWSPVAGDRDLGWLNADVSGLQNLTSNDTTKQWVQVGVALGALVSQGLALELGVSSTPVAQASSTGWAASGGVSWQR